MDTRPTDNPMFTRQEQLAPTGEQLAPTAEHDTHFYDPNADDDQVVAVYETHERAASAESLLRDAGIPGGAIHIIHENAPEAEPAGDATYRHTAEGFWDLFRGLFTAGEEKPDNYAEAVSRGHAVLVVRPPPAQRMQAVKILETTDPMDFNARLEEWRAAGWNGIYAQRGAYPAERTAQPGAPPAGRPARSATTTAAGRATNVVNTARTSPAGRADIASTQSDVPQGTVYDTTRRPVPTGVPDANPDEVLGRAARTTGAAEAGRAAPTRRTVLVRPRRTDGTELPPDGSAG